MAEQDKEISKEVLQADIMKALGACYEKSLYGLGKIAPPVDKFAEQYLQKNSDPKEAAKAMIKWQVAKCTTSGFITGFGGAITLPVTIPANIGSVFYVQMRMIACTAYLAGYDIYSDQVQSFVYACLAGVSVNDVVKQAGIKVGRKFAEQGIKKIPGAALVKINQAVGFRLVTKFGEKGIFNLGKMIPGVGAVISGGLDYAETKVIANRAYKMFFEGDFTASDKEPVLNEDIEDDVVEVIDDVEIIEAVELNPEN